MRELFRLFIIAFTAFGLGHCGSVNVSNLDPEEFGTSEGGVCTNTTSSFAADILPIFSNPVTDPEKACTSSECHDATTASGGLVLEGTAAVVYASITNNAVTNTSSVSESLLLTKPLDDPTGSHTGGKIFASSSVSNYQALFCWIQSGAAND